MVGFGSVMGLSSDIALTGSRNRIQTTSDDCSSSAVLRPSWTADSEQPGSDDVTAAPDEPPETPHLLQIESDIQGQTSFRQRHAFRQGLLKSAVLCFGVLILGLQWGVIGPSLPDLELLTGSSTTYIALLLTGRNGASLLGSVIAGFLIDRFNTWMLLGGAQIILGLLFALAPWSGELVLLALCLIPSGLAAGFYDTAVNVAVLRVWLAKPGPWIQAMECIDAIGSFIGPLIAQPFLIMKSSNPWVEYEDLFDDVMNNTDQSQSIDHNSDYLSSGNFNDAISSGTLRTSNNSINISDYEGDFMVDYGNIVHYNASITISSNTRVAYAYLTVGILLMLAGGAQLAVFCRGGCHFQLEVDKSLNTSKTRLNMEQPSQRRIRLMILPQLFAICFAYYALETGYAHYLMTFCVKYLHLSKNQGVAVTSSFWGAYTAGTIFGIIAIKYIRPRSLLIIDVVLCLVSQVILACFVSSKAPHVIWFCCISTGLAISTIFASVFSWTQQNIGVSGKVNALLMVGMATGELTSPAIIGILIDKLGAKSWVYCMLVAALLCAISFLCMHVLATKFKVARRQCLQDSEPSSDNSVIKVKMDITTEEICKTPE